MESVGGLDLGKPEEERAGSLGAVMLVDSPAGESPADGITQLPS